MRLAVTNPAAFVSRFNLCAFVGQFREPRGRWIRTCGPHAAYLFPRNAWTDEAVKTMMGRRS